jgi:hypothetical protein
MISGLPGRQSGLRRGNQQGWVCPITRVASESRVPQCGYDGLQSHQWIRRQSYLELLSFPAETQLALLPTRSQTTTKHVYPTASGTRKGARAFQRTCFTYLSSAQHAFSGPSRIIGSKCEIHLYCAGQAALTHSALFPQSVMGSQKRAVMARFQACSTRRY